MGLTFTKLPDGEDIWGRTKVWKGDIVFDTSYPTGGEAVLPGNFGFRSIHGIQIVGGNAVSGALLCHFDTANDKIMLHYPTGGAAASPASLADPAQAVPTVDNHAAAQTVTARLSGGNTITTWLDATALSDTPALAHTVSAAGNGVPGRGKELAAATDASTVTVRVIATGF